MKRIILFFAFCCFCTIASFAQDGEAMRQRMKERVKPQLMEAAKLSDAEAEKVLEINFEMQRQRRELRMDNNVSTEEKEKKTKAINEEMTKKLKAVPLTEEQVKAVELFWDTQRKNMQQRNRNGERNG